MTWYSRTLTDTVTRWIPVGSTGWGTPSSWTRSSINCKWEESQERFIDREGRETVSSAVVYVLIDVNVGDYLFHGSSSVSDPRQVTGAFMVRNIGRVETMTRRTTDPMMRKAML